MMIKTLFCTIIICRGITIRMWEESGYTMSVSSSNFWTLTWRDISYVVKRKENDSNFKTFLGLQSSTFVDLLNGVNGVVTSGTLMAIMGPSGAGKTTLLATISRRAKGEIKGDILLNGNPIDQERMVRVSGFVPQRDLVIEALTVQEHMEFMACMKMDRRYRTIVRMLRISTLLEDLALYECKDSKLSSLSSGERKRVSLAVELITEPGILFCDEPTTGLDSYSALTVVKILRDVATRGKIVVCSLHQPASGLLDVFHEVVLISGGRIAFQGSTNDATDFFASLNMNCPTTYNKAEFYVSQLSVSCEREAESHKKIQWICNEFENSKYGKKIAMLTEKSYKHTSYVETLPKIFLDDFSTKRAFQQIKLFTQIKWLTWRTYIDYKRNSTILLLRFVLYMIIALLISSPYVNIMEKLNQSSIQNIQGLLYLAIVETIFTYNYGAFFTFPRELPLLLREIAGGLYDPVPYYISKIVVSIPGAIFQPILYGALIFTLTGLKGGFYGFSCFILPVILCAFSASAAGYLISASFKSMDTASLVSIPIDFIALSYSGIYLHLGDLNPFAAWIKYVSQFYYGLEAVSLTQWSLIDHIDCSTDLAETCISDGLTVLDNFGYSMGHYSIDVIGLLILFSVCHFAAFLVIRYRSQQAATY